MAELPVDASGKSLFFPSIVFYEDFTIRTCTKCNSSENGFYKSKLGKDGLTAWCKRCFAEYRKVLNDDHPEKKQKHREQGSEWKRINKEKSLESTKRYQINNPEATKSSHRKSRQKHVERVRIENNARSRRVKFCTPKYANKFFISEAYHLAQLRTKLTGIKYVVDHIIPINGKFVCGLHIETNLQVITAYENLRKSNVFDI